MFAKQALRALNNNSRLFSTSAARQTRVAVLGAGGGIGQPLSLLLKTDPLVSSLSLYDIRGAPGVAADVSHIDTQGEVRVRDIYIYQISRKVFGVGNWLPRRQA